jgi:hypothetical protein
MIAESQGINGVEDGTTLALFLNAELFMKDATIWERN